MSIFSQTLELSKPKMIYSPMYPDPIPSKTEFEWVDVGFRVSVQQIVSTEGTVERPQVITQLNLFTPPGTDIPGLNSQSRVRVGGMMVCDVVGKPARWPDPYREGTVHHVEAILEIVEG